MKIQHVIVFLLLASCCAVSAQTTNALTNTNAPSLLTAEQATSLAIRLAGEKARKDLGFYGSFQNGQSANFVAGRWIWHSHVESSGTSRFDAAVELAANGSTNQVSVIHDGGLP